MQRLETYYHAGVVFTHLAIKARLCAGRLALVRSCVAALAPRAASRRLRSAHALAGPPALTLGIRRAQVALLTTYLLCELLNHGAFVINFVLVVLLQAVEFWYVKVRLPARRTLQALTGCASSVRNPCAPTPALTPRPAQNVSGRKLVGLRYWNYTSDTGENEWQFESRDAEGMAQVQVEEKRLFWTTLYLMARARALAHCHSPRAC